MDERFIGLPKENIIEITTVDENTVIEGKHVMLFAEYLVEESLTLRDCLIEICGGGFMGAGGELVIEDCAIKDPISRLISRDFGSVTVKNTEIFWQDMFPCLRCVDSDSDIVLESCRFNNPNLPEYEEGERDGEICDIPVFKMSNARLAHCSFVGFRDMNVMTTSELVGCKFDDCGLITVAPDQDDEDERRLCNCEFCGITALSVLDCRITDCRFTSCNCDTGSLVTTDSDVVGCCFSDISLSGSALAVSVLGEADVKKCEFEAVTTDRPDGRLVLGVKRSGFLGLKKTEYDPVDRATCKGL